MRRITFTFLITLGIILSSIMAGAQEAHRVVVIPLFDDRTGNSTTADVLAGKTFSNANATGLKGIMPNNGNVNLIPGTAAQAIAEGYHDGSGAVAGDADLDPGNIRNGIEIFGVTGAPNVVDTASGDAVAEDILSGKKAWVDGVEVTGSAAPGADVIGTNGSKTFPIPDGHYSGSKTATAIDTDLTAGNIKSGVDIFGVAGDSNVVDTSSGDAVGTDIAYGKKAWVDGSEITGSLYAGVTCTGTLNGTRWCDNGDGTVMDMTTGLVWLQKADWRGLKQWRNISTDCGLPDRNCYDDAHMRAGLLKAGSTNANLSDGSVEGDWRLPTKTELHGLMIGTEPVSSNYMRAFSGVQAYRYWSSTSTAVAGDTSYAWYVPLNIGGVFPSYKHTSYHVWPVRGGR